MDERRPNEGERRQRKRGRELGEWKGKARGRRGEARQNKQNERGGEFERVLL